jgi:Zn-dependent peptidase ImmA (M78 family)
MQSRRAKFADQIGATLSKYSRDLAEGRALPVDVFGLCAALNVIVEFENSVGRRRGALIDRNGQPVILVSRRRPGTRRLTPAERFTVVHELGHYITTAQSALRPQRASEYWSVEDLCNEFAANVLMPESAFAALREPSGSRDLAEQVNQIAIKCGVSAEPVARAVAVRLGTPVALGYLRLDPLTSTSRLGFRLWWVTNAGEDRRRNVAIYSDAPLGRALREMVALHPGEGAHPTVSGLSDAYLRKRTLKTASLAALIQAKPLDGDSVVS